MRGGRDLAAYAMVVTAYLLMAATAALVALSLTVYAIFDLGVSRRTRTQAVERMLLENIAGLGRRG